MHGFSVIFVPLAALATTAAGICSSSWRIVRGNTWVVSVGKSGAPK